MGSIARGHFRDKFISLLAESWKQLLTTERITLNQITSDVHDLIAKHQFFRSQQRGNGSTQHAIMPQELLRCNLEGARALNLIFGVLSRFSRNAFNVDEQGTMSFDLSRLVSEYSLDIPALAPGAHASVVYDEAAFRGVQLSVGHRYRSLEEIQGLIIEDVVGRKRAEPDNALYAKNFPSFAYIFDANVPYKTVYELAKGRKM